MAKSGTMTIEKRGRFHCVVKDGRVIGHRRSYALAFALLVSMNFRPIGRTEQAGQYVEGEIGKSSGFCWYSAGRLFHLGNQGPIERLA